MRIVAPHKVSTVPFTARQSEGRIIPHLTASVVSQLGNLRPRLAGPCAAIATPTSRGMAAEAAQR